MSLNSITTKTLMGDETKVPRSEIFDNLDKQGIARKYYMHNHKVTRVTNYDITRYIGIAMIIAGIVTAAICFINMVIITGGFAQHAGHLALLMFPAPGVGIGAGLITLIVGTCKKNQKLKEEIDAKQVKKILEGIIEEQKVQKSQLKRENKKLSKKTKRYTNNENYYDEKLENANHFITKKFYKIEKNLAKFSKEKCEKKVDANNKFLNAKISTDEE